MTRVRVTMGFWYLGKEFKKGTVHILESREFEDLKFSGLLEYTGNKADPVIRSVPSGFGLKR